MWIGLLLIVLCIVPISIVVSTIHTGISPMPSSRLARDKILSLIPEGSEPIVDLGSGWGGLLLMLSKSFPNRHIIGYECSLLPFIWSRMVCRSTNISIYRDNFLHTLPPEKSVLVGYLCPTGMRSISQQYKGQAHVLISCVFSLPNHKPLKTHQINDIHRSKIYVYQLLESAEQ